MNHHQDLERMISSNVRSLGDGSFELECYNVDFYIKFFPGLLCFSIFIYIIYTPINLNANKFLIYN